MDDLGDEATGTWTDTYRGHRIAVSRQRSAWQVAVDGEAQDEAGFETEQEAAAWLRRRVDARIAEAIYPGLARV